MSARRQSVATTLLLLSSLFSLSAQQTQPIQPQPNQPLPMKIPSRHAGDQVHYDLRVGGPEGSRVFGAYFMLKLSSTPTPEQEDHQASFVSGWIPKGADGVFHGDLVVPPHLASGDYALTVLLRATPGTTVYRYDRTDFRVPFVHIESDQDVHRPEITITERP